MKRRMVVLIVRKRQHMIADALDYKSVTGSKIVFIVKVACCMVCVCV